MNAAEILYNCMIWMPDAYKNHPPYKSKHGPGQYVERASESTRKELRKLKSDDIANIRPDALFIYPSFKEVISDLKLKFDKEYLNL